MSSEQIFAKPEVIDAARDQMSRRGLAIAALPTPVRSAVAKATEGAGEFADEFVDGADGFELSWTVVLDAMSTSLGNVAANLGGYSVDLVAVDLDLSD